VREIKGRRREKDKEEKRMKENETEIAGERDRETEMRERERDRARNTLVLRFSFILFESTGNRFGVLQIPANVGFDVFLQAKTLCNYVQFVQLTMAKQNVKIQKMFLNTETNPNPNKKPIFIKPIPIITPLIG
jgi:hypothetical protein